MSYLEIGKAALRRARARRELDQVVLPIDDFASEARRQRLLAKLRERPGLPYAVESEHLEDGTFVIVLAIPGVTCELVVPVRRDPLEFCRDLINAMERAQRRDKSDLSDKRGRR